MTRFQNLSQILAANPELRECVGRHTDFFMAVFSAAQEADIYASILECGTSVEALETLFLQGIAKCDEWKAAMEKNLQELREQKAKVLTDAAQVASLMNFSQGTVN